MNTRITAWSSPSRYIQGAGITGDLHTHCKYLGGSALILVTPSCGYLSPQIEKSYTSHNLDFRIVECKSQGEQTEIEYYANLCVADYIVGVGGGKITDLTKAIAGRNNIPCVIVPSVISTDAPATSRSVIYNLDGSSYAIKYDKSPDLIIVDTEVIFKSPLRFFISGIGDAITTKFEAEANNRKMRKNLIKGNYFSTYTGMVISDVCYDTLIGSGKDAVSGIQSGCHNESVDKVIEAVVLMSGLGAENCGCGIAHAVGEGIALVPTNKVSLHGEQVAFGLICQLIAEKRDVGVIRGLLKYYGEVGLPKTLGELGIDANDRNLGIIAGMAISRACWVEAIDVPVTTVWQVKGIIKQADDIGSGI